MFEGQQVIKKQVYVIGKNMTECRINEDIKIEREERYKQLTPPVWEEGEDKEEDFI